MLVGSTNTNKSGGLRKNGIVKKDSPEAPLVSVITVVRNSAIALEQTIRTIQQQDYQNIEHIVIDGCSSDGTLEVIERYENAIDYWISEVDRGIYDAMNKGINDARGTWINFLNAGDYYVNDRVISTIAQESAELDVIHSLVDIIDHNYSTKRISGGPVEYKDFFFQMPICHQGTFYNREVFERIGRYLTSYRITADHEWMLRFLTHSSNYKFVDRVTVKYSAGGFSVQRPFENAREKLRVAKRYFPPYKAYAYYLFLLSRITLFTLLKNTPVIHLYRRIKGAIRSDRDARRTG